ncbi:MAG: hypothetical protein H6713_13150 [Myxococcales bacterium]|nr:hypothetical protein [Myxococcales bacterium]MCB9750928.1 hypothetical protein [Myxococcales bacterium]
MQRPSSAARQQLRRAREALVKLRSRADVMLGIELPCEVRWDGMQRVADGVRHCDVCDAHVYDLAGLSRRETIERLRAHGGAMCAQVFARADGRVVFGDCVEGATRMRGGLTAYKRED